MDLVQDGGRTPLISRRASLWLCRSRTIPPSKACRASWGCGSFCLQAGPGWFLRSRPPRQFLLIARARADPQDGQHGV